MQVSHIIRASTLAIILAACLGARSSPAQLIMLPPDGDPNAAEQNPAQMNYEQRIAAMLVQGQYDDLDRLADKARRDKTRVTGGAWRLTHLYTGLTALTKTDTAEQNIGRLKNWVTVNPQSITARVALAQAYTKYAWAARTAATADKVTPEGWKLFNDRIATAHKVLDDAAKLEAKCPQWFSEMQTVALAENWEHDAAADLFARAVKFEPGYIPFYRDYANYLLPKWDGKPGEAADFAKQSADSIGGQQGDYLYFEIGSLLLNSSNNNYNPNQLDWPRLQRGFKALAELYGTTNADNNRLALMAWRYKDLIVAQAQFATIGARWSASVWKTRARFERAKAWANPPGLADTGASPVAAQF
jgi:hypothetical protein